jgi:hypothetical protein
MLCWRSRFAVCRTYTYHALLCSSVSRVFRIPRPAARGCSDAPVLSASLSPRDRRSRYQHTGLCDGTSQRESCRKGSPAAPGQARGCRGVSKTAPLPRVWGRGASRRRDARERPSSTHREPQNPAPRSQLTPRQAITILPSWPIRARLAGQVLSPVVPITHPTSGGASERPVGVEGCQR